MDSNDTVSSVLSPLKNLPINFSAGKISSHYAAWQTLTSDAHILGIVKNGYKLELESLPFVCTQNQIKFNATDNTIISKLIQNLKTKGVMEEVISTDKGEVISNIFVRPKSDGDYRLILNLKKLNEHVEKIHFQMETLHSENCWMEEGMYFSKILQKTYKNDSSFSHAILSLTQNVNTW